MLKQRRATPAKYELIEQNEDTAKSTSHTDQTNLLSNYLVQMNQLKGMVGATGLICSEFQGLTAWQSITAQAMPAGRGVHI